MAVRRVKKKRDRMERDTIASALSRDSRQSNRSASRNRVAMSMSQRSFKMSRA